jgi:hypothetical protein
MEYESKHRDDAACILQHEPEHSERVLVYVQHMYVNERDR